MDQMLPFYLDLKMKQLKSCGDFRIAKPEKKIKEEKKVFSPQRNRIKRNIKIKK